MPVKCQATRRSGKPCGQHSTLDTDGYCKYHQSSKYKPTALPTPKPVSDTVSPDETECNLCCSEFPSDQSWKLMGFGCCAFKMCRTCAEKVDNCPGCRHETPRLKRSTGRVPSHVTEGDHAVAARLSARLNTTPHPPTAPRVVPRAPLDVEDAERIRVIETWVDASERAKWRVIRGCRLSSVTASGGPYAVIRGLRGLSRQKCGLNMAHLKTISHQVRSQSGIPYPPRRMLRADYETYLIKVFVGLL